MKPYYVKINTHEAGQLLPVVRTVVPSGKTRGNEAEGLCIGKGDNCEKIWFTKDQIIVDNSPDELDFIV